MSMGLLKARQCLAHRGVASRTAGSAATSTALSWLIVWVRALTAEALASSNTPQHLHRPVTGRRVGTGPAAEHCGPRTRHRGRRTCPAGGGGLCRAGCVGAGALHSGPPHRSAGPGQQRPVASCGGQERLAAPQHTQRAEHCATCTSLYRTCSVRLLPATRPSSRGRRCGTPRRFAGHHRCSTAIPVSWVLWPAPRYATPPPRSSRPLAVTAQLAA